MTSATYMPGSWVAVSGPGTWLLVDLPPGDERVGRCWASISEGCDADAVLDELASVGVRATPAFALVQLSDDGGHVVVRHAGRVDVTSDSGRHTIAGDAVVSWVEASIGSGALSLELSGSGETTPDVMLPMAAGVTMAAQIRVQLTRADEASPSASARPTARTSRKARASTPREASALPSGEPEPTPEPSVIPQEPQVERSEEDAAPEEAPPSYDHLFGATQRPIEEPSTEAPAEGQAAPHSPAETAVWQTLAPSAAYETEQRDAEQVGLEPGSAEQGPLESPDDGVIDALPWEASAKPPKKRPARPKTPPPSASPPREPGIPTAPLAVAPLTEATVDRSSLRAAAVPVPGPTVLAGYCPVGHLTPPHAPRCRVCGVAMEGGQEPFEIARPPLGVLRLSTGDLVTVDRPVVLGRAPEVPADATERPHALRLVSPENDISRNHAEVVLDGWHVYVRDLNSTNGTEVTLPGQQPVRLRPGELQLLEDGATVTLADEMSFTFEVEE